MSRRRALDRTLKPESRIIGMVSVAILVVGAFVLISLISPGERRRREVVERLEIGDEAERVAILLGDPTVCPAAPLDHLRSALPAGWPPTSKEAAMVGLTRETAARWVFPMDEEESGSCAGAADQTEIGLDAQRRVLWFIAVTGRTPLELPRRYAPGAEG